MLLENDTGFVTFHFDKDGDLIDLQSSITDPDILTQNDMFLKVLVFLEERVKSVEVKSSFTETF
jgi:hypothetical protein